MPESKVENIILVFIAIFLTGFFSGLFQNNLVMIIFNLVGFSVSFTIYIFGYPLRKRLIIKLRNPLKRVISDLEQYDNVKEDPISQRKIMTRLYKHLKITEFLEGSLKVIASNSPRKPMFTFQLEGADPLLTIQFWILSGDQPYQFMISGIKENYYSNRKRQAPNLTPEENTEKLKNLIAILNESIDHDNVIS